MVSLLSLCLPLSKNMFTYLLLNGLAPNPAREGYLARVPEEHTAPGGIIAPPCLQDRLVGQVAWNLVDGAIGNHFKLARLVNRSIDTAGKLRMLHSIKQNRCNCNLTFEGLTPSLRKGQTGQESNVIKILSGIIVFW